MESLLVPRGHRLDLPNRLRRAVALNARLPSFITVEDALTAVMCTLSERLTAGGLRRIAEHIPFQLRPLFATCVLHREGRPTEKLDRAELLARVADHLGVTPAHAELICSAVFVALRAELSQDAIARVAEQLPKPLKHLWLAPAILAPDLDVSVVPYEARRVVEADLERRAKLPLHVGAAEAFSSVMCSFSRRLSGGESRHLFLGLPLPLRSLVERCAHHRDEWAELFGRDELVRDVAEHLQVDERTSLRIIGEVLRATKRMLPQETIGEIDAQLPHDLLELWHDGVQPQPWHPRVRQAIAIGTGAVAVLAIIGGVRWLGHALRDRQ